VAYSKKNFKERLWSSNNVWVRVPKQVSLQFTSKRWQQWRCPVPLLNLFRTRNSAKIKG